MAFVIDESPPSLMPAPVSMNNLPPEYSTDWPALLECAAPDGTVQRLADLIPNISSWPALLERAEYHGVARLLAEYVTSLGHALVPSEIRATLRDLQRAHIASAFRFTAELFRLLRCFAEAGIEVLVTKGPALAVRCYGDPSMRPYINLDLVVRKADIRRATEAMLDLGYEPRVPLTAIDAKKMPGEYA